MPLQSKSTGRGTGLCLLSIDSGGRRAISQLTILVQVMHRLSHDSREDPIDRPCGVFDMIGGVGSGGFIAILLVTFGLTAEQTLEEFIDLCVNVLDKQDIDAETRTVALQLHVSRLLEKYGIGQNSRIVDSNDHSMGCKLTIPISYKHHAGSTCILRNYSVRKEKTLDLTIAEAMMATLATPPMFTSTEILKDAATFEYMSADWTLSNPTEEVIAEAHEALGAEQRVACILNLGCGRPGLFVAPADSSTVAWNAFLENLVADSERKAQGIDSRMGHLGIYHRFSVIIGLEKENRTEANRLGEIVTHTQAYLDDITVSRKLDGCTDLLRIRGGVSSLDQLSHSGGGLLVAPQPPPVTEAFVMRKAPYEFVKKTLLGNRDGEIVGKSSKLIVTGVGGCGKTQLMLNFMKEHKLEFPVQIFIDGSSEYRIRADVVQSVRSLGIEHSQKEFEDCLLFLSSQADNRARLLVYDNVDDPDLDLSPLLPRGDSCAIAITSRNDLLGVLLPEAHLQLDIMAPEEAVELLLHGRSNAHNFADQDRIDAAAISEALGCLPIALQQARAYMRQTKCSAHAYLERLSTSRTKLLRRPIKQQLDARAISTYTAFETSFSRLPEETQKLFRLLSYFHWSGFPLELVAIGGKYQFSEYEETDFPHGDDFYIGKTLLQDIFLRNGEWDVTDLDMMTISLQNYSLVSMLSGVGTLLLQTHPLLHEWVRTCIPESEADSYRSAAILLLAFGARDDRTPATQYLASHVTHMIPLLKNSSMNNVAAFTSILYENGVYQSAVELQETVVEELRRRPDTTGQILSNSLGHLAEIYRKLGRLNEAETLQQEVLRLKKEILGERHLDTITALSNLGSIHYDLMWLKEAEASQKEVLKLRKEILGEQHPDTIEPLNNLALIHRDSGRLSEAEALQNEVLRLSTKVLGKRHPHAITASSNLALIYRDLGRLNEAEPIFKEVLKLRKEILGEKHPLTLTASTNLALTYCDLGSLSEAEEMLTEELKLSKEILGERHPETITTLNNLAHTYHVSGKLHEAGILQEEVLKLRKEILGERHPSTITALNNLASTYEDLGNLKEAEALFQETLKLRKEVQGERHPHTILAVEHIANIYWKLWRLSEAETLLEEVLRLSKEVLGERHPDTINTLTSLAITYRYLGRLDEAEGLIQQTVKFNKETLGEHHPGTIASYHELAIVYRESGRLKDAKELQEQVLNDRIKFQGKTHLFTIVASSDLAAVLRLLGMLPEAETLAAEVLRLGSEILGGEHPTTLLASYRLAAVYHDQGCFNEAETRLRDVLDSMQKTLGSKHYDTTATMLLLSKVYRSLNRIDAARELLGVAQPIIFETWGDAHPQYTELQEIVSTLQNLSSASNR